MTETNNQFDVILNEVVIADEVRQMTKGSTVCSYTRAVTVTTVCVVLVPDCVNNSEITECTSLCSSRMRSLEGMHCTGLI